MITADLKRSFLLLLVTVTSASKYWKGANIGEYVSRTEVETLKWPDECVWDKVRICFLWHD